MQCLVLIVTFLAPSTLEWTRRWSHYIFLKMVKVGGIFVFLIFIFLHHAKIFAQNWLSVN